MISTYLLDIRTALVSVYQSCEQHFRDAIKILYKQWEANQLAINKAWPWICKLVYRETNPSGQSGT